MGFFSKKEGFTLIPRTIKLGKTEVYTSQKPQDLETQQSLITRVVRWCTFNSLLIMDASGSNLVANITGGDLKSRLPQYIYTMNLRKLCDREFFNDTLLFFTDTEFDHLLSRMIELHIQLVTELDSFYINLYIAKLIHTLNNIYPDNVPDIKWEDIFRNYPYLWVLFPIQKVMREATPVL